MTWNEMSDAPDTQDERRFPCPCCGYFMFSEQAGSHDICKICFWEDDLSQLRFVETLGANGVTLLEGQENFANFGACEEDALPRVRRPATTDRRDESWRRFRQGIDPLELPESNSDYGLTYLEDRSVYYYWRHRKPDEGT